MKKIYTFILAMGVASLSFAQGYDLELNLVTPTSGSTQTATASVAIDFTLTNNGPTDIATGDTIWLGYSNGTSAFYALDGTLNQVSGIILQSDLTSGSAIGSAAGLTFDLSSFNTGDTVNVICFGVNGAALTAAGDPNETDITNNTDRFFIGQSTAGIEELNVEVTVYPNPTIDVLNINASEAVEKITVIGLDGKTVAEATQTNAINVSDLNSGRYFYVVETVSGAVIRNTFVKL